jgi:RNA polymerase sigma factor (sigma-70 family)
LTNEELAVMIRQGRTDLYAELWEHVRRFVEKQARRRCTLTDGLGGVTVDDLMQSGFLALVEAVEYFDPGGGASFIGVLDMRLKSAFSEAGGYRTTKRDPLVIGCKSLSEPVKDDEPEGDTLLDLLKDPEDQYESAEEGIYLGQLRRVLDSSVADLPIHLNEILYRRYVRGDSLREISEEIGVSLERVRQMEKQALTRLERNSRKNGLREFVDRNTNFYTRVGLNTYNTTHTSAVELLAMHRERLAALFTRGR